jgi:predicted nucleotidyltransferase
MSHRKPTPLDDLNRVLDDLTRSVKSILTFNLIGMYLQGSFGLGGWDADSDVDFTVMVKDDLNESEVSALQDMHGRIFDLPVTWAQHLEGSYFPMDLLKNDDPQHTELWYLDNYHRVMIRSSHDNTRVVRWVLREYGIPMYGPSPKELVNAVTPQSLCTEVRQVVLDWAVEIRTGHYEITNRWAQPFVVISCCRMLHTLATGRIWSKPAGAAWGIQNLEKKWIGLIDRALADRPNPTLKYTLPADPQEVTATLDFIDYTVGLAQHGVIPDRSILSG